MPRVMLCALLVLTACGQRDTARPDEVIAEAEQPPPIEAVPIGDMELTSPAFQEGSAMPVEFTCDGQDISPPLAWSAVPAGTAELVLTLTDPDAPGGNFAHWIVMRMAPQDGSVQQGEAPIGAIEGTNDLGRTGYAGPCPPEGEAHRYVFSLHAIQTPLGLDEGASMQEVAAALSATAPLAGAMLTVTHAR